MDVGLIVGIVVGIAYAIWAYFFDKRLWRNKPREVLEEMIKENQWMMVQVALEEVRRRGEDIKPYAPIILRFLVSDNKLQRVAGKVALKKLYPDLWRELPDYEGTASTENCVAKAKPLLEKFGILS